MCDNLNSRVAAVERNWEADKLVLVAILLASYAAHALPEAVESFQVLRKCRETASRWIQTINSQTLNSVIQTGIQNDIKEIQTRLSHIALCVILSFDAPLRGMDDLMTLEGALDFQLALQTLHDNTLASTPGNFRVMANILDSTRVDMLQAKAHRVIASRMNQVHKLCASTQLLTHVVETAFEGLKSQWLPLQTPWVRYSAPKEDYYWTKTRNGSVLQIGVADGVFLVNGAPSQRLPSNIEESSIFKQTFGNYIFIVVPKGSNGFMSKEYFNLGSIWEFSVHDREVTIVEHQYKNAKGEKQYRKLQLLPSYLFEEELQLDLVGDYTHWYCEAERVIEFRSKDFSTPEFVIPKYRAQVSSAGSTLTHSTKPQYSMKGPLFDRLMDVFQRLDDAAYTHMYKNGDKVAVHLLRLGLDFEVVGNKIHSVQFSDYIVCSSQYPLFLSLYCIIFHSPIKDMLALC